MSLKLCIMSVFSIKKKLNSMNVKNILDIYQNAILSVITYVLSTTEYVFYSIANRSNSKQKELQLFVELRWWLSSKESACQPRRLVFHPGSGRSPVAALLYTSRKSSDCCHSCM